MQCDSYVHEPSVYSTVRNIMNKRRPLRLLNFEIFPRVYRYFQVWWLFCNIYLHILFIPYLYSRPYVYSFWQIFSRPTVIPCPTSIPDSRVDGTPKGLKVVQSQKVFPLAKISPKKVPKHSPEHYSPNLICDLPHFFRFEPKWNTFWDWATFSLLRETFVLMFVESLV